MTSGENPFGDVAAAPAPLTDPDLERALIALLLADNQNFDKLGDLQPEDLSDYFLQQALTKAQEIWAAGRPVNLVTLKPEMEGVPLPFGTGLEALRKLSYGETLPAIGEIAKSLKSLSLRRSVALQLSDLSRAAWDRGENLTAVAANAIRALNDVIADDVAATQTTFRLQEASDEFIEWLQSGEEPVEISTGLRDLDEATGGWHRGEFAILAGRPGMGKSCIALGSTLRTARAGDGVLFFSLEMTKRQIMARALADFAYDSRKPLAYSRLKPTLVTTDEIADLYRASEAFNNLPIEFDTRNGLTVGEIMARARRAAEDFSKQGKSLNLVVVDHMLKVRPSDRYRGNSVKELDEISEGMCVMAKSLNVAVLGLHQLNRQVESRDNQRPTLADLRGSGTLEQDADVVLFAYRPAYPLERQLQESAEKRTEAETMLRLVKHDLEIQIAKQRNGPTKTLEFFVDMQANVVRDKAPVYREPPRPATTKPGEIIFSLQTRESGT